MVTHSCEMFGCRGRLPERPMRCRLADRIGSRVARCGPPASQGRPLQADRHRADERASSGSRSRHIERPRPPSAETLGLSPSFSIMPVSSMSRSVPTIPGLSIGRLMSRAITSEPSIDGAEIDDAGSADRPGDVEIDDAEPVDWPPASATPSPCCQDARRRRSGSGWWFGLPKCVRPSWRLSATSGTCPKWRRQRYLATSWRSSRAGSGRSR